jgi:hypothetical protein
MAILYEVAVILLITGLIGLPSYKIAKQINNKLNGYLCLSNHYNVKNSIIVAEDLTKLTINENHKMVTYEIKELYVNIPIEET